MAKLSEDRQEVIAKIQSKKNARRKAKHKAAKAKQAK